MLAVISPAKSLDMDSDCPIKKKQSPQFLDQSEQLISVLKNYNAQDLSQLMKISQDLGELNANRNQLWQRPFTLKNAKAAIFAFQGDVYQGINAPLLDQQALDYIEKHTFILSGLYGLLRPFDLIQGYRLEMGTKLETQRGNNLYQFWGERLSIALSSYANKLLANESTLESCLVNLASNEYFKVIQNKSLTLPVITPVFKDFKNGEYKIISFYAKKARGMMIQYMATKKVKRIEDLKSFNLAGYSFSQEDSSKSELVFTRKP